MANNSAMHGECLVCKGCYMQGQALQGPSAILIHGSLSDIVATAATIIL